MLETIRILDILVATTLSYIAYQWYSSSRRGPLPPGPKGWPIIGYLGLPKDYFWKGYADIGKQYGELRSLS